MKIFILILFCLSEVTFAKTKDVINKDLEQRISNLEKTVLQLQSQILNLSSNASAANNNGKTYSCFLKNIKGTFIGKGTTIMEAKGKTLKACADADKGSSFFCKENELKCDN